MGKSLAHFVKGWEYCAYLLVYENKILSTINTHCLPTFGAQLCKFCSIMLMRATLANKSYFCVPILAQDLGHTGEK
jgi:hypothetical protein